MKNPDLREELVSRFFRYTSIASQSDSRVPSLPSSAGQATLASVLASELTALGLDDVTVDENAIVTAIRRGSCSRTPRIGFIAHLDTVDIGLSPTIRPQIFRFDGEDILLNAEKDIWLRVADHPEIQRWQGDDVIVSDGTSVLGADNKAAISVIMTLLARLNERDHRGDIIIAFVPDEEIGLRGAKALDLSRFPCDFAYTIDACALGEVVIENFNAALCEVTFTGVSAHPMSAKGTLVNPLFMAMDFIAQFDRSQSPENTDGRDGFFWFKDMTANDSEARLYVLIRDFDRSVFMGRKQRLEDAASVIRQAYPTGRVSLEITDTYANIGDHLGGDHEAATLLFDAMDALKIERKLIPMRGGTDGAALSIKGIPTPNFFTGAHNFHSRFEFLPVTAFEQSYLVAAKICELAAGRRSTCE